MIACVTTPLQSTPLRHQLQTRRKERLGGYLWPITPNVCRFMGVRILLKSYRVFE
jgi:hypothetical protein